jgi:PadR family transcriptional regulator, regulatory protein PadR
MMSTVKPCRQQSRFLPAFALLFLAASPMHGGALQSLLREKLPGIKADSAAVYRALAGLEKAGELRSEWEVRGAGPAIRVYELTAAGRKKLALWQEEIACRLANLQVFVETFARLEKPRRQRRQVRTAQR